MIITSNAFYYTKLRNEIRCHYYSIFVPITYVQIDIGNNKTKNTGQMVVGLAHLRFCTTLSVYIYQCQQSPISNQKLRNMWSFKTSYWPTKWTERKKILFLLIGYVIKSYRSFMANNNVLRQLKGLYVYVLTDC